MLEQLESSRSNFFSAELFINRGNTLGGVHTSMALLEDLVDLLFCHPPFRTSIQVNKHKRHLLAIIVNNGQE